MKVLDLFSGIGGFSLGLERAGMETIAFCEIESYPRKVLAKHWPDIPIYEDVRNVTKQRLEADGIRPDVICGGFPCQDLSFAGNQKGIHAEKSGLWGELCRIIGEVRPQYAIVENVTALISGDRGRWFSRVLGDLAEIGYDCEWHCIPASELGAHHHRDRIWIIAHPRGPGGERRECIEVNGCCRNKSKWACEKQQQPGKAQKTCSNNVADTNEPQRQRGGLSERIQAQYSHIISTSGWETEPSLGRVANGVPDRAHRLKGLGNAVVPQIPELIGRAILEAQKKPRL